MGQTSPRRARASTGLKEHLFLKSKLSPFGRAVVGMWPDNAPKILSERMRISVRNANQIMRGERKVTGRALLVVNAEMLG